MHILAKEIVLEAREILLPKAIAQVGNLSGDVAAAIMFPYDGAEAEVDMGDLRPDAVVTGRGRQLLIEFHVRHPCGPEKIAKLRSRNLAAVELDLSRVPKLRSRAEHAEHILHTAPRHWLHNAKVAAEEARLRLIAERMAEAERRRRYRLHGRITEEVAAAWQEPARRGHRGWLTRAAEAGFGEFAGVPMPGDRCFAFDAATWQAAFLFYAAVAVAGRTFTAENALNYLQREGMLKGPFKLRRNWEPELVVHLRERIGGFRSPIEVMAAYATWLAERGLVERIQKGWRADYERGWEARARIDAAEAARKRETDVRAKVILVLKVAQLPTRPAEPWMDRVLPGFGGSPRALARAGGNCFENVLRRLRDLERMAWAGGDPVSGDLLGLPLEGLRRTRQAEAHARQETRRRIRGEFEAQVRERRRRESLDFVDALLAEAALSMGEVDGLAWVEHAVRGAAGTTFDEGRLGLDRMTQERIKGALDDERRRIESIRHATTAFRRDEAVMTAETVRCRQELEIQALRRFPGNADMARLWLSTTQPALGQSPWTHSVDERRRDECLRLLDAVLPKGRRR
ncbi:hypothetical protein JMJ56_29935 [Belnapia sp. T18]|uniref:DUF2384 domain-containing protein n=1 Tax=Belnapia arida TaxID=2804533 RepID=A0ABS1UBY6_9PROT|nr:hypothetical protein [Belnapia arida]MBL6082201.1 hypothetical protein [Belnapia arida]